MTLPKNIRTNIVPVLVLFITAIAVIFYQFVEIPKNLHFDEVEFAKLALSLRDQNYIPYSPLATGHATLYFYILLLSQNLFGINTFALRFPSALFGVVNIVLFYILMKQIFEKDKHPTIIAFLAALIFISMRWYFNFARFSFEVTFLLTLELSSLIFFLMYKKNKPSESDGKPSDSEGKQTLSLICSGIFAGLAYNSYTAGRLFVVIPAIFLFIELLKEKIFPLSLKKLKPLLTFLIPFVILILPITIYLSQNRDIRVYQLFMIMNDKMELTQKIAFVWENIVKTFAMFSFRGDPNGVHNFPNKPALNPILGILFMTGLGLSFWKWKKFPNQLFLVYFFTSLLPTLLVYPWENPHMLRTFTTIPAVVYFVIVSIQFIIEKLGKRIKINWILTAVFLLIITSMIYELRTYFLYQKLVLEESFRKRNGLEFHLKQEGVKPSESEGKL